MEGIHNSFTTKSNLQFSAVESGSAVVELYNITGTKIRTLFSSNVLQRQVNIASFGDALLANRVYVYYKQRQTKAHWQDDQA